MKEALSKAISTIECEQGGRFNESFAQVNQLLAEYGETGLADRLLDEIPPTVSWEVVADLLGILIWSTSDNGAAIMRGAETWLREGNDIRKIMIGLSLDVYPFLDREEMQQVLERIAGLARGVTAKCEEVVASRRKLHERETAPR